MVCAKIKYLAFPPILNEQCLLNGSFFNTVMLLIEENERQKKQVEEAKVAETQAKREARHSKVFGWVSFGIATAISIAALVVSIIALF